MYVIWYAGMFRLQREEPYVVVGDVRSVHLPRLLGGAPQPRRAPHVRAFHAARHQLDMEAASGTCSLAGTRMLYVDHLRHNSLSSYCFMAT